MTTITVVRAKPGGYVGSGHVHPALMDAAREAVSAARQAGTVHDGYVARCGDAVAVVLAHPCGPGSASVTGVVTDAFAVAAAVAARLGQHGVPDPAANGGVEIEGAEITFEPRPSEPVLCFLSSGAAGAFDLPLYRMFADPLNTPRLLDELSGGFRFVAGAVRFDLPADLHGMLATVAAGEPIRAVSSASSAEQAAAASAGDDPVLVVRCEGAFPSVADCLEPFAHAPLMPVSTNDDATTRPGIERVVGLGFQFSSGRLVGPRDLLGDRAYESARRRVLRGADDAPGPARLRPVPARPLV